MRLDGIAASLRFKKYDLKIKFLTIMFVVIIDLMVIQNIIRNIIVFIYLCRDAFLLYLINNLVV